MKAGVVIFPGSNCDHDMVYALRNGVGVEVKEIWHKDELPEDFNQEDLVELPGGFSYGDYLRCGAIARFSPVMRSIMKFAEQGGKVLGVCNGFQILCESHLLPGALLRNEKQHFICKNAHLIPVSKNSLMTKNLDHNSVLNIPIAHAEGRYYADEKTIETLEANDQVLFRYCDSSGQVNAASNPNGAVNNIAGIVNARGNVFGMMPHPERASDPILGNNDGFQILQNMVEYVYSN